MLKNVGWDRPPCVKISDAEKGASFAGGLEYNPPARGVWNIVHTGMLIPETHQIFACAQGCLRGVILTAAEMNAIERLSWISVSEEDMFDGTLESDIVDGVCEIIEKLENKPRQILLYLSCIHLFAGVDFEVILSQLSEKYPDIDFTDCYMTPTMRKTISPDAQMRKQLYHALRPLPLNDRAVNIVGCDRPTFEDSEFIRMMTDNGITVRDITRCSTYEEYLRMAEASVNISYLPTAKAGGDDLEERFGAKSLYLPNCFDYDKIKANYAELCKVLSIDMPGFDEDIASAEKALEEAKKVIGDTPVAIDFTAVTRPFEFALLLVQHGFNVKYIIADELGEDGEAFDELQKVCPGLMIYSALNVNMLFAPYSVDEKVLAIGQKAAYYFASDNFVNIVANGGYYGFKGIEGIAELMADAYQNEKDRRTVIQHKGIGCESCIV